MRTGASCPRCKEGLTVRRTRKVDGVSFIGCNRFPKCRYSYSAKRTFRRRGKIYGGSYWDKDEYHEMGEWNPSPYEV